MNTRYFGTILVTLACIAAVAWGSVFFISRRIEKTARENLLVQVKQASLLVSATDIASLSGSSADLSNPVYQSIKTNISAFRVANPAIRFVYVMGYRPEIKTQFFYVDSEPTSSSDYSPPGQLFADTRQSDIVNYLKGEPYTDGPYNDSWGEWVSGYMPLHDQNGAVVGMLGIDIATTVWHAQVRFIEGLISVIALLIFILSVTLIRRLYKKQETVDALKSENLNLSYKESSLREVQHMAQLGKITFQFPDEIITVDDQFGPLFGAKAGGKIALDQFIFRIKPEDRPVFQHMLDEMKQSDISYTWADVHIGAQESGYRKYHIYGNVKRNELGGLVRFAAIMQDVTDITS